MQKILPFILLFVVMTTFGQKQKALFYVGGKTENLPNVQLYLGKDSMYDLKLLRSSCWLWEYLSGKFYYENDSLVLVFQTFHPEPLCQIIDTFHKQRTLKLLYINDKNKVVDKLLIDLNNDTTNVDHFPLTYSDTITVNHKGPGITYTYYAPFFTKKSESVRFYKPKIKPDQTYFIKLKVDNNILIPGDKFKYLFKPFNKLVRQ